MLNISRTGLTYVCYLMAKTRPEHTIAGMTEGELRAPRGGMEFAQEAFSE